MTLFFALLIALIAVFGLVVHRAAPGMTVDPAWRGTVAAQVYAVANPDEGEPIDDVSRRIKEIGARPDDAWVLVRSYPPVGLIGGEVYRQEHLFNDRSVLALYSANYEDAAGRGLIGVEVYWFKPQEQ